MGGFQTQVGVQPAPAVAGDFASGNPVFTVDAGPGGLVAGLSGVVVGRFAWAQPSPLDTNNAPQVVNSFGAGPVTGFVGRNQQGLITQFLASSSMVVPQGYGVTLHSGGDFWVKNDGTTQALIGQKAYADHGNGSVNFAATGGSVAGGSATGSIAATTGSFTGSISGNILTITVVGSGVAVPGGTISGTNVVAGTKIVNQISGTPGGVGTYGVSIGEQTVASTAISETYGTFTAASALTGSFSIGDNLTGTGISVPTAITAFGAGTTGGLGTYIVDVNTVVASATITAAGNVETKWYAMSSGMPGELVKISDHPLG